MISLFSSLFTYYPDSMLWCCKRTVKPTLRVIENAFGKMFEENNLRID